MLGKSIDWFLYNKDLRRERIKGITRKLTEAF